MAVSKMKKPTAKQLDKQIELAGKVVAAWEKYLAELIGYKQAVNNVEGTTPPGNPPNPPNIP